MAKFEKGHKKVGGKEKGVPNKITTEFKELFTAIIEKQAPHIEIALEDLRIKNFHYTLMQSLK